MWSCALDLKKSCSVPEFKYHGRYLKRFYEVVDILKLLVVYIPLDVKLMPNMYNKIIIVEVYLYY